jgi:MFS family permease
VSSDEDAGRLNHASNARIWTILITLVVFSEVIPVQYSVVSLILPKIGAAFPSAGANATWSLTIIGVVGGATLPLAGKVSDLFGKKRSLLGLAVLLFIGTLLCAVTSNWALFLVGRALMGTSFCMSAVAYGVVRDLIPRRLIPVVMGVIATGFGASAVLAPLMGGALTDHYSWRSIFWFLLIYVAVTTPALAIIVPESPYRVKQQLDIVGALLLGFGLAGMLIYVSEGSNWGWGGTSLIYFVGGLALIAIFIWWENRISYPLMELSMLREASVATVMAISLFSTMAIAMPQLAIPYMFETPKPDALRHQIINGAAATAHVAPSVVAPFITFLGDINYAGGLSVFQIATHITVVTSVTGMILGPIGGLVARRYGARLSLILSGIALMIAFELWTPWHGSWQDQAMIGVAWGAGFGFFYAGGPNVLIDKIPAARQGISASMYAAFGSIGSALAVALCTPILAAHPFQIQTPKPSGTGTMISTIPQVYTNTAFSECYLLVGGGAALCTLLLALYLQAGREPAKGGIVEDSPLVAASLGEFPSVEEPLAVEPLAATAVAEPPVAQTVVDIPAVQATAAEAAPSSDTVVLKSPAQDGAAEAAPSSETVALKSPAVDGMAEAAPAEDQTVKLKNPPSTEG